MKYNKSEYRKVIKYIRNSVDVRTSKSLALDLHLSILCCYCQSRLGFRIVFEVR